MINKTNTMTTEAEEQAAIQYEVDKFNHRLQKLNKKHKFIQVTGLKLQINHPALVKGEPVWKKNLKLLFNFKKKKKA